MLSDEGFCPTLNQPAVMGNVHSPTGEAQIEGLQSGKGTFLLTLIRIATYIPVCSHRKWLQV